MIANGKRALTAALLMAGLCAGLQAAPALAQYSDYTSLEGRLARMEREVTTLSQHLYTSGAPGGGAAGFGGGPASADMEVRLARLERVIQELTGNIEENAYAVSQLRDRMTRLGDDLEFRLSRLEGGSPGGPNTAGRPSAPSARDAAPPRETATRDTGSRDTGREPPRSGAGSTAALTPPAAETTGSGPGSAATLPPGRSGGPGSSPGLAPGAGTANAGSLGALSGGKGSAGAAGSGNPQADYDNAYAHLRKSDYESAEKAFRTFIGAYPDHKLTPNALYWLAETYYARNMFKEAAVAFADGFKKEPNGGKATDNLLKLGMSLASLNRSQEACVAFGQLLDRFPSAPAAVRRRAEQERQRLTCK